MRNLLRHLDIRGNNRMRGMPDDIGNLSYLQPLIDFVVSKNNGNSIRELGKISQLRGRLRIYRLKNVVDEADAYQANLSSKAHLDELVLERENSDTIFQSQSKKVLDALTPHTKLGRLTICKNIGKEFPNWVRDKAFCNLKSLHMKRCLCVKLPSLGQLPSLKHLIIEDFKNLDIVGEEFYGQNNESSLPFKLLLTLEFKGLRWCRKWYPYSYGHGGEVETFHCLEKLSVWDCESLEGYIPLRLPSLVALDVHNCYELKGSLPELLNLCILNLRRFGNLDLTGLVGTNTLTELSWCGTPWESNYNKWTTNAKEALPLMTSLEKLSIEVHNTSKQASRIFDLKAWIYVPKEFDATQIISKILYLLSGITSYQPPLFSIQNDLQVHQEKLREKVAGKRIMIILDDIWDDILDVTRQKLLISLKLAAPGSTIIVTTRNENIARNLHLILTLQLHQLPNDDAWTLF
ncbi:putative disease resistance RPP13-like protein 1 [Bienertia sinuspersici]